MIQYAPNPTSFDGEGYECLFCGCDHAPRFGPCLACRRESKDPIPEQPADGGIRETTRRTR